MKQTDGGPAFPISQPATPPNMPVYGMSLRDWFASQAPISLEYARSYLTQMGKYDGLGTTDTAMKKIMECTAMLSYRYADEMIARRQG